MGDINKAAGNIHAVIQHNTIRYDMNRETLIQNSSTLATPSTPIHRFSTEMTAASLVLHFLKPQAELSSKDWESIKSLFGTIGEMNSLMCRRTPEFYHSMMLLIPELAKKEQKQTIGFLHAVLTTNTAGGTRIMVRRGFKEIGDIIAKANRTQGYYEFAAEQVVNEIERTNEHFRAVNVSSNAPMVNLLSHDIARIHYAFDDPQNISCNLAFTDYNLGVTTDNRMSFPEFARLRRLYGRRMLASSIKSEGPFKTTYFTPLNGIAGKVLAKIVENADNAYKPFEFGKPDVQKEEKKLVDTVSAK